MEAPFKVGQRVVRVGNTVPGICINGEVYTVKTLQMCKCGMWRISCDEFPLAKNASIGVCFCGHKHTVDTHLYFGLCKFFAPIDESKERIRYVAVSETLREQAVEIAAIETN